MELKIGDFWHGGRKGFQGHFRFLIEASVFFL